MLALLPVQLENIPGIRLAEIKSIETYGTAGGIHCFLDLGNGEIYEASGKCEKTTLVSFRIMMGQALKNGYIDLTEIPNFMFHDPD